jgi:PKD repeat protein
MRQGISREHGAAEMVGVLMLIALFVVVVAVIAVILFSTPPPEKNPAVNLYVTNQSRLVKLYHAGGDPLQKDKITLLVDGTARTFDGFGEDNTWSVGEILEYTLSPSDPLPNKIDIVYAESPWRGSNAFLIATLLLGTQTGIPSDIPIFTILASASTGGTISESGPVQVVFGTDKTFAISAGPTYTIANLTVDGVVYPPSTTYTFTNVTQNHVIIAMFNQSVGGPFTINATAGPGGLISPGNVTVPFGSTQAYTITPNSSYRIANVIVNGTYHLGPVANFTFANVTANQTISASFVPSCTSGLTGKYYSDQTWTTLAASNTAGQIHFADTASGYASDVTDWPVPYIGQAEDFSVNFTGSLKIRAEDDYTFYLTSDDGSWLNLNGTLIIDNSGVHSPRTYQSTVHLKAGNYPIIVRMFENTGQAVLYLEYTNTSITTRTLANDFCRDSPPVASFNATPVNGNAPLPVQFTDLSTDANVWTWDFGDGSPVSNDQNPLHTYTTAGQYNVTLLVANSFGNSTATKTKYITVGYYARGFSGSYYPNANWIDPGYSSIDPRIRFADVSGNTTTQYDLTDRIGWPIPPLAISDYFSVIWDGYLRVPADDSYSFYLKSDDGSCLLIDEVTVVENGCSPRTPHSPLAVTGSTSLTAGYHHIVVKMFEETGQAVARLDYKTPSMAAYEPVTDVWYVNKSLQAPIPLFSGTPVTGIMPLTVQFNDSSLNAPTSWSWTFGDGSFTNSTLQNPLHTYATAGTYNVTLTATNTAGSAALTRTSYVVVSPILWSITATNSTGGVIIPNGTVSVVQGTDSSFTITPNVGKNIFAVLVDGSSVGTPSAYTFTNVTANHTIVASFANATYTVTASSGANGAVTPAGITTVNYGDTPTFNITPNVGYHVSGVLANGTSVGTGTSYTFPAVTGNKTISATFAINTYTITASPGANGVITPAGITTVNHGDTPTFNITPDSGYYVTNVIVNGTSVGSGQIYTFPSVTRNTTISATFAQHAPAVTGISPTTGTTSGNTLVTITGTNLTGATAVWFGTNWVVPLTNTATTITVNSPAGSAGTVDVIVTTPGGNSPTSSADKYTYTIPITAIGAISGTTQVGSTLTAGALTPLGATATYQWQSSITAGGTYSNIAGATASTYTLASGDLGDYIRVVATGTGSYSGTVTSVNVGPVTTPLTGIGAITGTPQIGSILTAGALTPSGATATYQWQRSLTSGGTYTAISGATTDTYTPVAGDVGYYLRVIATGSGSYTGTVTSTYVGSVTRIPLTAIGAITGTPQTGSVLTAGALTPSGATATYQWQRSSTAGGTYTNLSGATAATYTPVAGDRTYYIRVLATGSGSYTGAVYSAPVGPLTTPITSIGAFTGTIRSGRTLTVGALVPSGATATYHWQRATTSGGVYSDISGATGSTYILAAGDIGYYIRVEATGSGSYTGIVYSAVRGPVTA